MEEITEELSVKENKEKQLTTKQTIALVVFILLVCACVIAIAVVLLIEGDNKNKDKILYYELNQEFMFYDVKYTVLEYEIGEYYVNPISYNTKYPSNENNLLCSISLKLYNPTNKNISFNDEWGINCKFNYVLCCDGAEYNTKYDYSLAFLMAHDSIDALETLECDLLFEAPKEVLNNSKKIELKMSLNKKDADVFYVVKLKG